MAEVKVSALTALTGANVANGDELYIVDTGSPNVSKKITADELAQMPQLSSRYVAKTDEEYRWIPAAAFDISYGGPSYDATDGAVTGSGWKMDANGDEYVASSVILPDYWATFRLDFYWCNASSSSGDVRWNPRGGFAGDTEGSGTTALFNQFSNIAAPTTAAVLKVTQVGTTFSNTTGKPLFFAIGRIGINAGDTLANDAIFVGALLTRQS